MDVPDTAVPRAPRRARSRKREWRVAGAQDAVALALRRLAERTGASRCAAWSTRPDGTPFVAASLFSEGAALAPNADELAALATLERASRLAARAKAELRDLGARHGFEAAAPIERDAGPPSTFLLFGGMPGGAPPPPRALAALDAIARQTAPRLAAADATARFASLDAEVRRLDRLAALGELVAEIVHEVRNPLVSVKTFLQLLPERIDDPEFRTEFLGVVADELRRIERLLDGVLAHARPRAGAGAESSAEIGGVVESVVRLVAHRALERDVRLETALPAGLPRVGLGEDALRQVVLNLALNAIDATPAGRTARLSAEAAEDGLALIVEDEGPGVPVAIRERVFEPFFSTKAERPGGLGLAISRRIVEEAGGRIAIDDRPGGGTRFRVSLPSAGG